MGRPWILVEVGQPKELCGKPYPTRGEAQRRADVLNDEARALGRKKGYFVVERQPRNWKVPLKESGRFLLPDKPGERSGRVAATNAVAGAEYTARLRHHKYNRETYFLRAGYGVGHDSSRYGNPAKVVRTVQYYGITDHGRRQLQWARERTENKNANLVA